MITDELFEAFINCELKAHLCETGASVDPSEFLTWQQERLHRYQASCRLGLRASVASAAQPPDTSTTDDLSRSDLPFFFNCRAEAGPLKTTIDAVEPLTASTIDGASSLVPIRFVPNNKVTKHDRICLAYSAHVLSKVTGTPCTLGKIIHGDGQATLRVKLTDHGNTVRAIIVRLAERQFAADPPPLVLNRHCPECEFRQCCRTLAVEKDELTLLSGMSRTERKKHHSKGIFTVTQLSYTFRPRKRPKRLGNQPEPCHHSLRALAIREGKIHIVGKPEMAMTGTPVFLDVEGIPDRAFYYLIGVRAGQSGTTVQHSFWADGESDERVIWTRLLSILSLLDRPQLIHYGDYERIFLKRMKDRYASTVEDRLLVDRLLTGSLNVLSVTYARIYFPTYGNGLKEIARRLGMQWSDGSASGLTSLMWRQQWEASGHDQLKQKLIDYNVEDCVALERVVAAISHLAVGKGSSPPLNTPVQVWTPASEVEAPYRFRKIAFATPDLEYINQCAYWDYQRDRVYLRSKDCRPKEDYERPVVCRETLPIDQVIEYPAPCGCPECGASEIKTIGRKAKVIYDLKFGRTSVKRWVVSHISRRYQCHSCGCRFRSQAPFWTCSRYGHQLLSYMIYLIIEAKLSLKSVSENLRDLYGYDFRHTVIADQKTRASAFYSDTYSDILRRLVEGPLIQADETKIRLKDRDAYVWVLTSSVDVLYLFSDTREGSAIQELLKEFGGTLVSDFYAVYDSIGCHQQRCLIHLIRDLNEDLLKHPFDDEYRELVRHFTAVLKPAIETIDQFGLKAHYLREHRACAERFLEKLSLMEYKSDVASRYKQRFEKNKDRLFTFLHSDDIPWNNNNAEHAVKRFAALRERIEGSTSEHGLREYLILLSMSETCRCRGVRVLDFLRSAKTNICAYSGSAIRP